ncbi:hypothetical protein SPF06_03175 [Sinomonas sp. JGH33]|uniref:Uncharacterized protein n=1 Tax=Sinomonas terricola TaxID=3110330 RepID=A0ABU5T241_9MICC|nr:hypothetical protein [Sinomonas sp. JGH33]MEA5453715.1 hypothetical protein [Sinomonas sp. JGH33]
MMSRTLAHSRHLRRQALQRSVSEGAAVQTSTMGVLIADSAPDSLGFFPAHDWSGQTYVVSLAEVSFRAL